MSVTQHPPLLALPPELRNMIYDELAASTELKVGADGTTKDLLDAIVFPHGLMETCQQLRSEAWPVLVNAGLVLAPTCRINMTTLNFGLISQLGEYIEKRRLAPSATDKPQSLQLELALGSEAYRTLEDTFQQRDLAVRAQQSPFRFGIFFDVQSIRMRFHFRDPEMTKAQKQKTITQWWARQCVSLFEKQVALQWNGFRGGQLEAEREMETVERMRKTLARAWDDFRRER